MKIFLYNNRISNYLGKGKQFDILGVEELENLKRWRFIRDSIYKNIVEANINYRKKLNEVEKNVKTFSIKELERLIKRKSFIQVESEKVSKAFFNYFMIKGEYSIVENIYKEFLYKMKVMNKGIPYLNFIRVIEKLKIPYSFVNKSLYKGGSQSRVRKVNKVELLLNRIVVLQDLEGSRSQGLSFLKWNLKERGGYCYVDKMVSEFSDFIVSKGNCYIKRKFIIRVMAAYSREKMRRAGRV